MVRKKIIVGMYISLLRIPFEILIITGQRCQVQWQESCKWSLDDAPVLHVAQAGTMTLLSPKQGSVTWYAVKPDFSTQTRDTVYYIVEQAWMLE